MGPVFSPRSGRSQTWLKKRSSVPRQHSGFMCQLAGSTRIVTSSTGMCPTMRDAATGSTGNAIAPPSPALNSYP